ncbi:MAG: TlpA family protein disulfide reductase [Isosphaeraceae bacterium]
MFSIRTWKLGRLVSIRLALGALVCLPMSLGNRASAQPPVVKNSKTAARADNPQALALFGEVARAYKSLASYSDQGQFVIAMTMAGKEQKQVIPLRLTFVRPNKLDFDAGLVRVASDGAQLTTAVMPLKRYVTTVAPQKLGLDNFREGPLGAVLFGGPAGAPMFVLLSLLTAPDPAASIGQLNGSFQPAPAKPASSPADAAKPENPAFVLDLPDGPDLIFRVHPETKLLAGIELLIDPEQLAKSTPAGAALVIEQIGWTSGPVSTRVAGDRSFAFQPPDGFTKVDSLAGQGGGQEAKTAVSEKLGKPAPDFTLTVLDGPGKTKTITRAELAGKVVLIDFWATWCGPCLMELPEIQKLVESLAGSDKDVLIVALSQDDHPAEISEVRKLVEKTLSTKKINLAGSPIARIALDPSNSVGRAFEVEGYPTLVIIDGKGIVQSAHVGFNPAAAEPLHKSLSREIDAIRAGKRVSLDHPAGK